MTIQTRVRKDEMGHLVAYTYDDDPGPLTPEQLKALEKAVGIKVDEKLREAFEAERQKELLDLRQARLAREKMESLSPSEREAYNTLYNKVTIVRRLAEQAKQEADSKFIQADQTRQKEELATWLAERQKTLPAGYYDNGRAGLDKSIELADLGRESAQQRLQARQKRELEAEAAGTEGERIVASLDNEEKAILNRMLQEQPSELDNINAFVAEHRNPIADIEDPKTLYRLATEKPKREEFVEPLSNVENVNDSRMLYKMHLKHKTKR